MRFCKWIILSICGKTYIPNKAREIKDKSVENYLINDSGGTSKMGATIVTILAVASIFLVISFSD